MENKELEKGYNIEEAAQLLGRSAVTIRRYIKSQKLKAEKLGGAYVIPASELRKYLL